MIVNKVLNTETLKEDLSELVTNELYPYISELKPAALD